jgi:hypothetical protein
MNAEHQHHRHFLKAFKRDVVASKDLQDQSPRSGTKRRTREFSLYDWFRLFWKVLKREAPRSGRGARWPEHDRRTDPIYQRLRGFEQRWHVTIEIGRAP